MIDVEAEYQRLKTLRETAVLLKEGGSALVLLPKFSFRSASAELVMDLLLVPFQHSGYITRLFFEQQVAGKGQNWTQHRIVERQWWAPSWKDVKPTLPWPAMLCAHLRAVA